VTRRGSGKERRKYLKKSPHCKCGRKLEFETCGIYRKEDTLLCLECLHKKRIHATNHSSRNARRRRSLLRDNPHCYYCGTDLDEENSTLDHATPRSKGGKNASDNLVLACIFCNQKKGDKTKEEFFSLLKCNDNHHRTRQMGQKAEEGL
jgi:5-methylcytosine-specific restriction endonuclease McrA